MPEARSTVAMGTLPIEQTKGTTAISRTLFKKGAALIPSLAFLGLRLLGPAFLAAAMMMMAAMPHARHHEPGVVLLAQARQLLDKRDDCPKLLVAVIDPGRHAGHLDAVLCLSTSHSPAPHSFKPVLSAGKCTGSVPERVRGDTCSVSARRLRVE
jgi:hypothetical protein